MNEVKANGIFQEIIQDFYLNCTKRKYKQRKVKTFKRQKENTANNKTKPTNKFFNFDIYNLHNNHRQIEKVFVSIKLNQIKLHLIMKQLASKKKMMTILMSKSRTINLNKTRAHNQPISFII